MEGWKPTQILWAEQPLDTSTGAVRVETDCGSAYAKLLGNPEGPHVLACEVVGTRAANWLGLPTAEFAVVNIDQAHLVEFKDGTHSQAGPAFCSRLHRGATWGGTAEELEIVENSEAISGLVVLDTWLRNCDRYLPPRFNFRNVFFSEEGAKKGKVRLSALDHTHCFTCGRPLTPKIANIDTVRDRKIYGLFPEFQPFITSSDLRRYLVRFEELTLAAVQGWMADLPGAWEVNEVTRVALAEFLFRRARFLSERFEECLGEMGTWDVELRFEELS